VFDTIVESSPMSIAMSGISETSRPIPKSSHAHSPLSDLHATTVRRPNSNNWNALLLKCLVFLAFGVLAGLILLQL
jgi:hypothetical protein